MATRSPHPSDNALSVNFRRAGLLLQTACIPFSANSSARMSSATLNHSSELIKVKGWRRIRLRRGGPPFLARESGEEAEGVRKVAGGAEGMVLHRAIAMYDTRK